MQQHYSENNFNSSDNWILLNPIETSIKNKIEQYGTPLSEWNIQINYGIKTGYNDAFIIDESTKNALIASDPKLEELIRPILRGKDIKRYTYDFANLWIICIPCGFTNLNKTGKAEDWFSNSYNAIYSYLVKTEEELSKNRSTKSKGLYKRDDQGDYWWELRSCKYMDFNKPKLMYSEIVQEPHFYYDDNTHFYPEATTFIMNGDNLKSLLLILNSKLTFNIFKLFYAGGGLGENGIRYKKAFLLNLRLPKLDETANSTLEAYYEMLLVNNFQMETCCVILNEVENYISKLYNLSQSEIDYLLN